MYKGCEYSVSKEIRTRGILQIPGHVDVSVEE